MGKIIFYTVLLLILGVMNGFSAGSVIGIVKHVDGEAFILRNSLSLEAKNGDPINPNDAIKTGKNGHFAMVFKDDTLLSIGPGSEILINEFLFSPAEGKLSIITRLLKGTCVYLSGIIGKLSPEAVRFETPVANIGIRGTKFAVKAQDSP